MSSGKVLQARIDFSRGGKGLHASRGSRGGLEAP